MMKKIALYLPQYHRIKENDAWWGKGYTEWTAVRNAKPLFKGHIQPHVPLNKNYYDLSDENATMWRLQAEWAKEYGIDGFCIYHYWFETGKQLLEKPAEILLKHPEIEINYCFCWANETWTKTWYGQDIEVLIEQKYGDENEWTNHYAYLRQFFTDSRYICVSNKPMICIYRAQEIEQLSAMLNLWNKLAIDDGFAGLYVIAANTANGHDYREEIIDAYYEFEPGVTLRYKLPCLTQAINKLRHRCVKLWNKVTHDEKLENFYNIDDIYQHMHKQSFKSEKPVYPGIFPAWDNTSRRGHMGYYYANSSAEKFGQNLRRIIRESHEEFVFINAWNEWGEGCYLEPDEENQFAYLQQLKQPDN